MSNPARINVPVPGISFFTPLHSPSPGMAKQLGKDTPTLFRPLIIRGVTFRNRICVSPMCQYSCAPTGSQTGVLTPLYLTTIGHFAYKGASLVMLEATGVQPNGRISVNCPGLYNDAQAGGVKTLAEFVHSQGGILGVQLSNGGRKSSTLAPWIATRLGQSSVKAELSEGGWAGDVVAPSGGSEFIWDGKNENDPKGGYHIPRELSKEEILQLVANFAASARRAVTSGVDVIEIHAAHGYLLHQFLSPITNRRNDEYGGSFENRIRLTVDIIKAVRATIPATMPLFVRVSATDWMEDTEVEGRLGSWDVESTIRLANLLSSLGVDLLEVSSAGNIKEASFTLFNAGKQQAEMAARIRAAIKASGQELLIGTVGEITNAKQAQGLVEESSGGATSDVVFVGRQFLKEPGWVLKVAEELGVDVAWPAQLARPQIQGGSSPSKL